MHSSDQSPCPSGNASPASAEHRRSRWARLREEVTARTQLLMITGYLAATSVVGVEIVAVLLGMSALLPVAIPIFLLSLPLIALARNRLRRVGARRQQRHPGRGSTRSDRN